MKKSMGINRDMGLDLTRIIAFVSVPAVHFFLNSEFYQNPIVGTRMSVMTAFRTLFMICVPLFMLLSGYLMSAKEIAMEKKSLLHFYSKIAKVAVTYVLATVLILIFKRVCLQEDIGFKDGIFNILGYNQYTWYVEMYMGFFFLIPFLNLLWNSIGRQQGHKILVAVLLVLTVAPSILNIWDFNTEGALLHPWLSKSYNQLVPNWWGSLYPITYYYIGAYIRSHVKVKELKTWPLVLLFLGSVLVFSLFNIWRCYSIDFIWGAWCGWNGFQNVIDTVLIFLIINSIKYKKKGPVFSKIIALISELTFGAYIVSWIPDNYFYPKLIDRVSDMQLRFNYFPVMVLNTILISLVLSLGIHIVMFLGKKIFQGISRNLGKRASAAGNDAVQP